MLNALLKEELTELQDKNLLRKLKTLQPVNSTQALFQGKELVLFCGNDYLGLSRHPKVIEAAKRYADQAGVGATSARLISGTSEIHGKLEQTLAQFYQKEKALVFSAGYLANLGVLSGLAKKGDLIVMDKLCHASLIDGARLSGAELRVFPHKNYARCEELLKKSGDFKKIFLVSDTVFSMDGDLADIPELVRLKKVYGAVLMVDDAHGLGVLGATGQGALEDARLGGEIDVITGTLSKAVGCLGGFAAGSEMIIDYLINHSRPFIFATGLAPILCAAAVEALQMIRKETPLRSALWKNIHQLEQALRTQGIEIPDRKAAILPIMVGDEKAACTASEQLLGQGFLVPAIRYPTVAKGKARLRVTVSAGHQEKDILRFARALGGILKRS